MKKLQVLGIVRNLLIALFSFLAIYLDKKGITLPFELDNAFTMTVFSVIVVAWGIIDKSLKGANYWTSLIRSLASIAGGLMLAFGVGQEVVDMIPMISGLLISVITISVSAKVNGELQEQIERIENQ